MNNHLTDDEIQQFVLNGNMNDIAIQHIEICEACKTSVANYATLCKAVKEIPEPSFEFDVVSAVMPLLPKPGQPAAKADYFMHIILVAAIGLLCIPVYLYKTYLVRIFENMAYVLVLIISLPVIVILCSQFYDVYKIYKKQVSEIK